MRGLSVVGTIMVLAGPSIAADQIVGGDFEENVDNWWATDNLAPEFADGRVCADIPGGAVNPWDVIAGQDNITLVRGEAYEFSFKAWGDPGGPVRALVQENKAPYTAYVSTTPIAGPTGETYSVSFRSPVDIDTAQVVFQFGGSSTDWRVCLDDVSLQGGAAIKAYRPNTGPSVRVNQLGYLPDGPKRATVISDTRKPMPWSLRDPAGKVLLRGKTVPLGEDSSSGLRVHLVDFSNTSLTGNGFVISANGDRSYPFSIRPDLYQGLMQDALQYFYPARSGVEILGAIAGAEYARPAGHLGVSPNNGDTAVPCQSAVSSTEVYGVPWTCDYTLDVTGGWYDAGDHGKYVVNGGISVAQMMSAYEHNPALFSDGQLSVPEAGNGVPDILDEARWELEWMIKMAVPGGQELAGMVHHKVHDDEWTGLPLMPHLDGKTRSLHRPSTAATLNLAAVAAQGARVFRDVDEAFAMGLLEVAERSYAAAVEHPAIFAPVADGNSGGGPYDDTDVADEFFWAAAELYLTSGDPTYLVELESVSIDLAQRFRHAAFDWQNVAVLPLLHLATRTSGLPDAARDHYRGLIIQAADRYLQDQAGESFGQMYAPEGYVYDWGSNHQHLQNAIVVATAYDLTEDKKYLTGVLEAMDYIFGRNALNLSYATGYGTAFSQNQHSRWFAHQINPELPHPPKGALAGGPNSSIQDPVAQRLLQECIGQFCYIDDIESWSTNEITINWNASLAQIAAVLAEY